MAPSIVAIVVLTGLLHASWNAIIKGGPDTWMSAAMVMGTAAAIGIASVPLLPMPGPHLWPWLIYSGIIHTAYQAVLVLAYRHGDLGHVYPIARGAAPAIVVIASWPLLGEALEINTYAGIALVILAVFSLTRNPGADHRPNRKSFIYALLTGICIAAYSMIDAVGIHTAAAAGDAVLIYIMWSFVLGSGPFSAYVLYQRRRDLVAYSNRHTLIACAGGFVAVAGYGLVLWSYSQGATAPIAALRETGVLFAALYGSLLFGEGRWRQRLFAAGLVVTGVIVIQA